MQQSPSPHDVSTIGQRFWPILASDFLTDVALAKMVSRALHFEQPNRAFDRRRDPSAARSGGAHGVEPSSSDTVAATRIAAVVS